MRRAKVTSARDQVPDVTSLKAEAGSSTLPLTTGFERGLVL
jgi:hypothetical protein